MQTLFRRSTGTLRTSRITASSMFYEQLMRYCFQSIAFITFLITVVLFLLLLINSYSFFKEVSIFDFLFGTKWDPFGSEKFLGVLPLVVGTFQIAIGSACIFIPIGLGTAIYLTQYATSNTRQILTPIIEILGGIPTVVHGFFGLTVVTPFLKIFFPTIEVFNALSGSIVVGIAILPMIASISSDAILSVSERIKDAGYALGLSKFQVIVQIIIPAATSGIFAAFILGLSRAIGETMAVTMAAGATPNMEFNYLKGIQTMTAFIAQVSMGDNQSGSLEYNTIYALGITLFIITLLFNLIANKIVQKYKIKS